METRKIKLARRLIVALLVLWSITAIGWAVIVFTDASMMKWTTTIVSIVMGLLAYLCGAVFYMKVLRGIRVGKVFVPGGARLLCLVALLSFCSATARELMPAEFGHWDSLTVAQCLLSPGKYVSLIVDLLMALLYRIATEVSEENRLTV